MTTPSKPLVVRITRGHKQLSGLLMDQEKRWTVSLIRLGSVEEPENKRVFSLSRPNLRRAIFALRLETLTDENS